MLQVNFGPNVKPLDIRLLYFSSYSQYRSLTDILLRKVFFNRDYTPYCKISYFNSDIYVLNLWHFVNIFLDACTIFSTLLTMLVCATPFRNIFSICSYESLS